jgi:tripeptidyl-peptidase-1
MSSLSPRRLLSLLLLLANTALSAKTLDQLKSVPSGWTQTNVPAATQEIVLQIALTLQNLDQLEPKLASASTPGGPGYGQYLDIDDIDSIFGASDESKDAVTSWLQDGGVTDITPKGSSIWIKTTVEKANTLLGTQFKTYTDQVGAQKVRTTEYSVPDDLADHIDLVAPTTYFGKSKAARYGNIKASAKQLAKRAAAPKDAMGNLLRRSAVPAACNQTITYAGRVFPAFTPDCLKQQYNIGSYTPDPKSGASIAFSSFLNESASFSDLTLFEQHFGIPVQNFSVVLVNPDEGATDQPQPPSDANDGEANLDVQNIVGLTHPMPVTEYITAGSPPYIPDPVEPIGTPNENEPYLPYYEFLLSKPNSQLPQVITNSYGDEEQTVPEKYAVRVCNLIGLMGLRGISILESSGDEGVGASCLASDGSAPQFNPIFPVSKLMC